MHPGPVVLAFALCLIAGPAWAHIPQSIPTVHCIGDRMLMHRHSDDGSVKWGCEMDKFIDPLVENAAAGFASDLRCILGARYVPPAPAPCGEPKVPGHSFCRDCQVHFTCRPPHQ